MSLQARLKNTLEWTEKATHFTYIPDFVLDAVIASAEEAARLVRAGKRRIINTMVARRRKDIETG